MGFFDEGGQWPSFAFEGGWPPALVLGDRAIGAAAATRRHAASQPPLSALHRAKARQEARMRSPGQGFVTLDPLTTHNQCSRLIRVESVAIAST